MPVSSTRAGVVAVLLALLLVVPAEASARFVPGGSAGGRAVDEAAGASGLAALADVLRAARRSVPSAAPRKGVWPLWPRPEVVARFDPPAVRWGAGHRGADLAGHVGQPVRTALGGTVSFVGRIAGRGVVVVSHGPTRTTYQPLLPTAAVGDRLRAGEVIGRLTGTGSHCAPRACLHWGLRRDEAYLDPLTLVDAPRPVRLLPW